MLLPLQVLLRDLDRTFGAALTIALLIAAVSTGVAIVNGYESEVKTAVQEFQGDVDWILIHAREGGVELSELERVAHSTGAVISPVLDLRCGLKSPGSTVETRLRGIDPRTYPKLAEKDREALQELGAVELGCLLARRLNVTAGESVTLLVNDHRTEVRVVGVACLGGPEDAGVLAALETAWAASPENRGRVTDVLVRVDGGDLREAVRLASELGRVKVSAPANLSTAVQGLFDQVKAALLAWVLTAHAVIWAAVHTITAKLVVDKRLELGVLRALGATRFQMLVGILAWCSLVSAVGWLYGVSLGLVSAQAISSLVSAVAEVGLSETPPIHLGQMLLLLAASQIASLLGGLFPALRTSRRSAAEMVR